MNPWLRDLPPSALVLGWGLWCALHSALITPGITRFSRRLLGRGFRFYRFGYALFALLTLVPLVYASETAHQSIVFAWEGYARLVPLAGLAGAAFLFIAGAREYDLAELLGLRQIADGPSPNLSTSGILRVVRHPWYAACFPLIWSRDLTDLSIQINVVLTVYLIVGTLLEERKLVAEFGDAYRDYQREVPMFFPWKWVWHHLRPGAKNKDVHGA